MVVLRPDSPCKRVYSKHSLWDSSMLAGRPSGRVQAPATWWAQLPGMPLLWMWHEEQCRVNGRSGGRTGSFSQSGRKGNTKYSTAGRAVQFSPAVVCKMNSVKIDFSSILTIILHHMKCKSVRNSGRFFSHQSPSTSKYTNCQVLPSGWRSTSSIHFIKHASDVPCVVILRSRASHDAFHLSHQVCCSNCSSSLHTST